MESLVALADPAPEIEAFGSPMKAEQEQRTIVPPTRDRIYEFVRRAILLGEYAGRTFIEEEEICIRAGVSRTPVREAFQRLHAEQYIELVPRKGALVKQAGRHELAGMFQARLMIEGSVLELVCRERTPIPPEIGKIVEQMRAARYVNNTHEQLACISLDWSFHCSIVELSKNDVLIDLYCSLRSRYERTGMITTCSFEFLDKVYNEHVTILGLLQTYDLEGLKTMLQRHLQAS